MQRLSYTDIISALTDQSKGSHVDLDLNVERCEDCGAMVVTDGATTCEDCQAERER